MFHPPLLELLYFVLTVRFQTSKRAAEAIGIKPNNVSDAIARLEQDLGAPLIVDKGRKGARRVRLTKSGRRFFEKINPLFSELDSVTEEEFRSSAFKIPRQSLRIICSEKWASQWVLQLAKQCKAMSGQFIDEIHTSHYDEAIAVDSPPEDYPSVKIYRVTDKGIHSGKLGSNRKNSRQQLFSEKWAVFSPSSPYKETADIVHVDVRGSPVRWENIIPKGRIVRRSTTKTYQEAMSLILKKGGALLCERHLAHSMFEGSDNFFVKHLADRKIGATWYIEIPWQYKNAQSVVTFVTWIHEWFSSLETQPGTVVN
jgi:hypothetical protein